MPDVAGIAGDRLKGFLQRIETLEAQKAAIAEDIKDVYTEAKSAGFDATIMRKILRLKKLNPEKRREIDELTDLYLTAIGELV